MIKESIGIRLNEIASRFVEFSLAEAETESYPYAVYTTDITPLYSKDGIHQYEASVVVTIYAKDLDGADALAGEIDDRTAQDYMSTKVFTTTPGTPIESACKIMVRNGLRRIPIIGGEADISKAAKKLLGIVTSTDIIRFLNAKEFFDNLNSNAASEILEQTKLSEIMVKDAIVVEPEDSIGEICELFKISNIGGVPVVKDDDVIGIITERDILRAIKKL